ncbi:hypothetical protein CVV72_10390 [Amycolatopsis sp. TNS106]|nr:hypothetical protein CVV72_10390 [Amycolatopsis sp. TNS106]
MADAWADRARRDHGTKTYHHEKLTAEIGVLVESVELQHRALEENYRPYLHVSGELRSVAFVDVLPFGITEVVYSPGRGEKVDAFYEFDDQQLIVLARKGYFGRAFRVPEQIIGIEWELPATVNTLIVAPPDGDAGAPVIFTQVHHIAQLEIDADTSGYDLTDYFADHSTSVKAQADSVAAEPSPGPEASSSLFTDNELGLTHQGERPRSGTQHDMPTGTVASHLRRVESEVSAERAKYRAERARTVGTPEFLYHEHVARALQTTTVPPTALDQERDRDSQAHAKTAQGGTKPPEAGDEGGPASERFDDLDTAEHDDFIPGS